MADKEIRHEVIKIEVDSKNAIVEIKNADKETDNLIKTFTNLDKKTNLKTVSKNVSTLGDNAKKSQSWTDKLKNSLANVGKKKKDVKDVNDELDDLDDKAKKGKKSLDDVAKTDFSKLKSGLKSVSRLAVKGVAVAATGVGAIVGGAVKNYGEYEQLVGGVDTLFKKSSSKVQKYANDAYKTSGLSANDYMSTVTSFSASLLQSLKGDTNKAADYAHMAIVDMSDNANKMGTDMSSIQYAYQGFAKQNYTMLDNLKLGYGGTKTEMQRLVKDAAKIDKSIDKNSLSYGNVVKAIHAVQQNMGITGTTAKEASSTIQGSFSSLKSSWSNTLTSLVVGGDSFDQCVDNLIDSALTFGKNIMPAIEKGLAGVGKLVERLSPYIEKEFPKLVDTLLPPLLTAGTALLSGVIKSLPSMVKTVAKEIPSIASQLGTAIVESFGIELPKSVKGGASVLGGALIALLGFATIKKKLSGITSLFGKKKKGIGDVGKDTEGTFGSLAKMKTTTVLKGVANISIIIGAMGGLLWIATKVFKNGVDVKSMLGVVAMIGALGLVGAGLAKLSGIVGLIPVAVVAKGLANIAIVMVGMGALLFAATKVFSGGINFKQMLEVVSLIGIVGSVGAGLTAFAGIVGMIPIPVVLAGLANMALVLGGVTGLIVAFGKLSENPSFNDFITKCGETLSNIFNVIGKIGGSLIGGLGEGISKSLPTIGENIGKFGENIKPLFNNIKGVDMGGVGAFFTSIIGLLGIATGNEIVEGIKSFFGGGDEESSLAKLGTQLTNFANNAKGFFNTVATMNPTGFTNAKAMFDSLAGVKGLPKEGGVTGWFTGKINYDTLSSGLAKLASEGVITFFNTVATIKQEAFDNATKLFDCLAGLKSLPKDGGVVGWFSGNVDYSKIASGLKSLSSEGVANFFNMVTGLTPQTFENTKSLFNALASIKELPKEGGWWDKVSGEETSTLTSIGKELGTFSTNTDTFFKQVNSLNLKNLNGLWDSLKKPENITSNLSNVIGDRIDELVKKITDLPNKMADGLKSTGKSLSDALVSIWTDAVKASINPVNKVISGANWIMKEFGSDKRVSQWQPYAKGTGGHKGGNALVNDGRGAELIQMPNGRTFIPNGRNVFMPNAPKGMKVLPAEQTAQLMGRKRPTFRYAKGTDVDIWSYLNNASGLVKKITDNISYEGMTTFAKNIGKGMVSTISEPMTAFVKKAFSEIGTLASYKPNGGVNQWRSTVIRALKMEGLYSAANVQRTLYQMQTESGGNPRAINLWDSNAKKGTPSKGLMQVIDPTFKTYARAGFNSNIYDPLSNILASIRYAVSRYGSLEKAYRGVGYAGGVGEVVLPQYTPESSTTVVSNSNVKGGDTFAPVFNLTINGTSNDRETARKVKRWVIEALDEAFGTMSQKQPIRQS